MPDGTRLDSTQALKVIRTLIGNVEYASGQKLVDGTLREVKNVLDKALGEDGRPRRPRQ